jgi:outer membrane receptor protein involved in Fe transport
MQRWTAHRTCDKRGSCTKGGRCILPQRLHVESGSPALSSTNYQLGVFAQDDWRVGNRLTLNLGIRWDYESDMLNNEHVAPENARLAAAPFSGRQDIQIERAASGLGDRPGIQCLQLRQFQGLSRQHSDASRSQHQLRPAEQSDRSRSPTAVWRSVRVLIFGARDSALGVRNRH